MDFRKKLDEIYSIIPDSEPCIENCGVCCTPINWTPVEDTFITEYMKKNNIEKVTWGLKELAENNWKCPYLDDDMKCKIYPVRPLICRIMGHTSKLKCPNKKQTNLSRHDVDKITRAYMKLNEKYIESNI